MENRLGYAFLGIAFAILAIVLLAVARSPEAADYQGVYSFYALALTFAAGALWILHRLFPKVWSAVKALLEILGEYLLRLAAGLTIILILLLLLAAAILGVIFAG